LSARARGVHRETATRRIFLDEHRDVRVAGFELRRRAFFFAPLSGQKKRSHRLDARLLLVGDESQLGLVLEHAGGVHGTVCVQRERRGVARGDAHHLAGALRHVDSRRFRGPLDVLHGNRSRELAFIARAPREQLAVLRGCDRVHASGSDVRALRE
jgi:hypothetical protein